MRFDDATDLLDHIASELRAGTKGDSDENGTWHKLYHPYPNGATIVIVYADESADDMEAAECKFFLKKS